MSIPTLLATSPLSAGVAGYLSRLGAYDRAMSRRPDPARIQVARREATRASLGDLGLAPATIDARLDAWERIDPDRSAADYWQRGHAWIAGEVAARRKPPTG